MTSNGYIWKIKPFEGEVFAFEEHLRTLEQKMPSGAGFDDYVSVLLASAPRAQANRVSEIVENFCLEWALPRRANFREQYPDSYPDDNSLPGFVFRTPIKKLTTRVLDEYDVPSYDQLRKLVIRALLGVRAEEDLEKKMSTGRQNGRDLYVYISEFQNLLNVYNEVARFKDNDKIVRWFIRGLDSSLRARFHVLPRTPQEAFQFAENAAREAYAFGESGQKEAGNAFQIHPTRRHLFAKQERHTLFGEDKIEANPAGDVQLLGFASSLNEAETEAEYLKFVAEVCNLELDQSSVLAADRSSMAMLHGGVKTVLRNATRTEEALAAITSLFPQKFLLKRSCKQSVEKRKHSELEQINVMEMFDKKIHSLEKLVNGKFLRKK